MDQNIYKANFLKYPKNFNFREKFSKKEDGTYYKPWRNSNVYSNISNYVIHKSSIEPYRTVKNKVISYLIKGINSWLIVGATFIKTCKYRKDFTLVGIVPQFKYWTKINSNKSEKCNQIVLGKNCFREMIDLEKFDMLQYHLYQNKLTQLFNNSLKARELKIAQWEKIKEIISKNNKVTEEQNLMLQDSNTTNDSNFINDDNKSPPENNKIEWYKLQEKLKNL